MILEIFIEEWKKYVPWQTAPMIEQDLIISRALIDLYNDEKIKNSLVFRGGTALNKLYLQPPSRYSEDIDFVQLRQEPIGETIDAIRTALAWLGEPKRKQTERGVKLIYRFIAVDNTPSKLKIEINTTEHFQVLDLQYIEHTVNSEWFKGATNIVTYQLEELMATKLRALYQRRKGRDLFDVWLIVSRNLVCVEKMIDIFQHYCARDQQTISKTLFTENLTLKRLSKDFQIDMTPLLPVEFEWRFDEAFDYVQAHVVDRIPG